MYDKNYYLAHREEILARAKKWRKEHPERCKEILKKCLLRNKRKYELKRKLYDYNNCSKLEEYRKEYYSKNRQKLLEKKRLYRIVMADKIHKYNVQYSAKKRYQNIDGWKVKYEFQNGRFHWLAVKDKYKLFDEKENGFPTLHSAYKNAIKYLGIPFFRSGR